MKTDSDEHLTICKPDNQNRIWSLELADFLILATIRDCENSVLDYDDVAEGASGITAPATVKLLIK